MMELCKNLFQFLDPFLWIGIPFVYYIVYKIRFFDVDKRFLVYAVDMICILCLMPHRLIWTVPYCLFLQMMSHWMHWFARKQVEPLDIKYTSLKALILLVVLDVFLMLSYRNLLHDGSVKDRFTIEQALLMVNAMHTIQIWNASKALKVECFYCVRPIPEIIIFFEGLQLVGTIFILFYYWPAVGLGNVLYRVERFSTEIYLIGSRENARSAIESMEGNDRCGWVRLPCGHSYHRCCALPWFNVQLICPLCGVKISETAKPEPAKMQLHHQ